MEGSYSIQKDWAVAQRIPWSDAKAQLSAAEMFERIYTFKFTPPGRGLWMMGTEWVAQHGSAGLLNCAFVSTEEGLVNSAAFLMEASMLGIGVGFDTRGAGVDHIARRGLSEAHYLHIISDDREGWVNSVTALLNYYLVGGEYPIFDYSRIRPAGTPIKGFGGLAAGHESLQELHASIVHMFDKNLGEATTERDIVDLMNLIGRCVVSGNVRRSAEVALGNPTEEFLNLKAYDQDGNARHPAAEGRSSFGWASNNSITVNLGDMDFTAIAELIKENGEPGIFWLDMSQNYGRLSDPSTNADYRAMGSNPCMEQTLESYEACNLVETYPSNCDDREDYIRTLKFAYLYAKSVTLLPTHWARTNAIMLRNRRIGCSVTGAFQFAEEYGIPELSRWMRQGYETIQHWDNIYSEWLCVRPSIKTTSVKPSGTVSKIAPSRFQGEWYSGVTPGVHAPVERSWIQRIIFDPNDPMYQALVNAHYHSEPSVYSTNSYVVEIPASGAPVRTQSEVSMWEKVALAALMQRDWADNAVSVTISFNKDIEGDQIAPLIHSYEGQLKAISFLPYATDKKNVYAQMPMDPVPLELVNSYRAGLGTVDFGGVYQGGAEAQGERYCDTEVCEIPLSPVSA